MGQVSFCKAEFILIAGLFFLSFIVNISWSFLAIWLWAPKRKLIGEDTGVKANGETKLGKPSSFAKPFSFAYKR